MNAEQVFDPFVPRQIPFHVRGESVKDNGLIVSIDYVVKACSGFDAIQMAEASGLCRVVARPIKEQAND